MVQIKRRILLYLNLPFNNQEISQISLKNINKIICQTILFMFCLQNVAFGQLHSSPTCGTPYTLTWDSTPSASGEVNWSTPGALSNTFTNADNSGVDFTFAFSGDTGTLGDWNGQGGATTPGIGTNASVGGAEVLEYFTDGFNTVGTVTITISFSKPIAELGFDLFHVNGSGPYGDSYTITANTARGNTIYPTFTSPAITSYTTNTSGFIDSNNNLTTDGRANVGVNFSDIAGITSITMIWNECTACTDGYPHGSAFSNFSFCKIVDADNDNISDYFDLDDDNDGILDELESCGIVGSVTSESIDIEILLDDYASETTWELLDGSGTSVLSGGPYANNNTLITANLADGVGDYTFNIYDSASDGICCGYGTGHYEIKVNGSTIVGGSGSGIGNFGALGTESFSAGSGGKFSCLSGDPSHDADNDGTLNYQDADFCTLNANGVCNILDTDGDGIINSLDLDADNDGIPDLVEVGGIDTNGDGLIDYPSPNDPTSMIDLDGDGLADTYDDTDTAGGTSGWTNGIVVGSLDSDNDGFSNYLDLDADNDGIPDIVEAGGVDSNGDGLVDGLNPNGTLGTDADGDGYADVYDSDDDGTPGIEDATDPLLMIGGTDTNGDGLANDNAITFINGENVNLDTDGDGLMDGIDLDADNDGIPDLVEAGGIDSDGNGLVDVATDADNDGFADIFDTDDDGTSGVEDATDALLMTGGTDTDGDGKADDAAITFVDGDNVSADTDGDGFVDHLDLDADNDGIPDIVEAGGATPNNDGMVDVLAAPWDSDNDGLADIYDENNSGTSLVETTADTNGDGKVNATESMSPGGSNNINIDTDGYPNHLDLDADNDGITDVVENAGGTVSADNTSGNLDGIVGDNANVTDTDNNGWHDPSTTATTDSDGDGIPDYLDIDADNDGIVDYLEGVCSTCPTFVAPSGNDANGNGVLDMYENLTSANANSGTNIGATPNVDNDSGNTTPDYLDTDTDADGANDWTEGYDLNNDGKASDDLIIMAADYETATSNGYYVNATDSDSDGIPDWLDNQPLVAGHDETVRPPFLNQVSSFWHDDDNDGLVDLLDSSQNGTAAPTPDNNGGDDLDWRDMTAFVSLPVELSNFFAEEEDCRVHLIWTTESEIDFDYFEIQWSGDGHEFTRIGMEKNAGNANGMNYSFTDITPSEFNYYRLKMVDIDNSFEYSKVVSINLDCEKMNNQINVYPNPISPEQGMLNVEFFAEKTETQLSIVDLLGRTVTRLSLEVEPEMTNFIQIDISHLPAGTYSLQQLGTKTSNLFIIQE